MNINLTAATYLWPYWELRQTSEMLQRCLAFPPQIQTLDEGINYIRIHLEQCE